MALQGEVVFFVNGLKSVATRWVEPLPLPAGRYGSGQCAIAEMITALVNC